MAEILSDGDFRIPNYCFPQDGIREKIQNIEQNI